MLKNNEAFLGSLKKTMGAKSAGLKRVKESLGMSEKGILDFVKAKNLIEGEKEKVISLGNIEK